MLLGVAVVVVLLLLLLLLITAICQLPVAATKKLSKLAEEQTSAAVAFYL